MHGFTQTETKIFRNLSTPKKIQDFLDTIPKNFEQERETCYSPRQMLKYRKAHCLEGAIFAAAALRFHNQPPLILDLRSTQKDLDHVIALFKIKKKWGAISKTNHAVLRFREPVYRDIKELVMSYFHEYFLDSGYKTLRAYSRLVNLSRFDSQAWMTSEKDVWYIDEYLDTVRYYPILTKSQIKNLRKADPLEIKAGKIREWK
jgi:hypothetical protein